ncbi:MAG: radical SAM protein [Nanoarchaeota archaeon]
MKRYSFQDLKFTNLKETIRVFFLGNYYFDIDKAELYKAGDFRVENRDLLFSGKQRKLEQLIDNGFSNLYNTLTKRKTIYIHQNSGIPLIGSSYFGIVDRNTNLIELRPNTGCNLNCIYCSINESGKKAVDFVVEAEYLAQELEKLIMLKDTEEIEIHINPQGEPLLYKPLAHLVSLVKKIQAVKRISIDTNATALTKKKIDELIDAGITQFNISIDSLDEKKAQKISSFKYPVEKIKESAPYIKNKVNLFLTPLYLPGINDNDIEDIIVFAKKIKANIGIQNFLCYSQGKNPCKSMPMEKFYDKLRTLEKKHNLKLIYTATDFKITKTNTLQYPFKKNEIIDCEIISQGRLEDEVIAKAKGRLIEVRDSKKTSGRAKAKINRTKHNIFKATAVGSSAKTKKI